MLSYRRSFAFWAGAAALAAISSVAVPGAAAQPVGRLRTPQFVATAVSFKALHETHWNWLGSDEVQARFFDFTGLGTTGTRVFGDVDAGETKTIPTEQSCISPQPKCDGGASSLGFGVALVEIDDWVGGFFDPQFCHGALGDSPPPTPQQIESDFDSYSGASCPGDDFIGRAKVKLSQTDLLAMLPTVGQSVDTTVPVTGGAGRYEFTYRLTRLPDKLNIPPIGPAVALGISLQATVTSGGGSRVVLTWTGASTNTVDIYRDGALLVTTANDGSYTDLRMTGTYQYRLCNLGSTTDCSPVVTAVVP